MIRPCFFHSTLNSLFLVAATFASAGTPTQTPPPTPAPPSSGIEAFFTQDYLLGTWGGKRTALKEQGIDMEAIYFGSLPTNFAGGISEETAYQQGLLMILDLDLDKLISWKGAQIHAGGVWLDGDPFSEIAVGDFNKSSLLDLPQGWRLWELYFQQKLLDDRLTIKLGQMAVDRDFIVPEFYNSLSSINFLNQTFFFPTLAFNLYDIPGLPTGSHSLPSTPYGSLGALVKWQATPRVYVQAAVYDGYPDQKDGTSYDLTKDQGALIYSEIGYRHNMEEGDAGLPGSYKLGGFYHTDEFYDVYDAIGGLFGFAKGTQSPHEGNYGAYFLAEQMLRRETDKSDPAQQGLTGFFRLTAAPSDRNLTEFGVDGGFVFKGLIPGRDWDTLGFGASYLKMSDDIKRAQRAANRVLPGAFVVSDYEAVIELNYKLQVAAWWTLQPSLQYAIHPGGSSAIDNAWIFAVQTTVRF
ncbi:MAG: carbohydrate porin [Verrucomicrobiales bacterium]|nr:carbohydrate porin [Verrucomicrobiales bacterium]MCP5558297.1 carbohydrate porin [Verrucomicrobiaceae bacterium]